MMTEYPEHMEDKDPIPSFGDPGSKSFFQVPEGFFDAQKQRLDISIEQEELRQVAPLLFSIPKVPFFQVPNGFFLEFSRSIAQQVEGENKRGALGLLANRSWISSKKLFPYQIAAAIVVFLLGIWALSGGIKSDTSSLEGTSMLSEIPTHVLVEAASFHGSDTYLVVDILEEQGVEELPMSIFPEDWELEASDLEFLDEIDLDQLDLEGEIFESGVELN